MALSLVSVPGGAFFNRARLTGGCVGLIGATTVSSAIYLETKGQGITKLLKKIDGLSISGGSGATVIGAAGSSNFSNSVNQAFSTVGNGIAEAAKSFGGSVTTFYSGLGDLAKTDGEKGKQLWEGIKKFVAGWFKGDIFKNLVESLHSKLKNIILFTFDSKKRKILESLFSGGGAGGSGSSTLSAVKMLLGLALLSGNKGKGFKVEEPVFQFLLLKFLDDPERVANKFTKLSEQIKKVLDKLNKQNNGGQETQDTHKYELTIKEIEKGLSLNGEFAEKFFNAFGADEITMKIKRGVKLGIGKSLIAGGDSLGSAGTKFGNKLRLSASTTSDSAQK